jgi:hypothetical protein
MIWVVAERLHMGRWKGLSNKLYLAGKANKQPKNETVKK